MLKFYSRYFILGIHTEGMSARFVAYAGLFMQLVHEGELILDFTGIVNRTLIAFSYVKRSVLQSVDAACRRGKTSLC